MNIAHIINPVNTPEGTELFTAQPITFESMLKARNFSRYPKNIQLVTTQFEEDRVIIPDGFQLLSNLERSVLDVNPQLNGKKLPLVGDILRKTKEIERADYLIFTNMDIALMPAFYDAVFAYIEQGHDAVVINRRRLSHHYSKMEDLPLMYADLGRSHPGFDCFVFKRELLDQLILDEICVGISFLEVTLLHNLFAFAENPLYVPDTHLTFHIGMEVLVPRNNLFYKHNRNVFFQKIYPQLQPFFELKKFPYGKLPFPKRSLKWMLNPGIFTRNYLRLEGQHVFRKIKSRLDEIRWRILQR